jgi:hypothetical protein
MVSLPCRSIFYPFCYFCRRVDSDRFHPPLLANALIEAIPLLLPPPEASLTLILLGVGSG